MSMTAGRQHVIAALDTERTASARSVLRLEIATIAALLDDCIRDARSARPLGDRSDVNVAYDAASRDWMKLASLQFRASVAPRFYIYGVNYSALVLILPTEVSVLSYTTPKGVPDAKPVPSRKKITFEPKVNLLFP